jgi:hypothetical protein
MKKASRVKGYDRDAIVYRCKDCPHTETKYVRGTRTPRKRNLQ